MHTTNIRTIAIAVRPSSRSRLLFVSMAIGLLFLAFKVQRDAW